MVFRRQGTYGLVAVRTYVGVAVLVLLAFLFFVSPAWAQNFNVVKEADPSPAVVGQELTYTVTITNSGARIENLVLTDDLPDTVQFVEFGEITVAGTPDPDACEDPDNTTGEIVCDFNFALPRDEEAVIEIVVVPSRRGVIENTVQATGTRQNTKIKTNPFTLETPVLTRAQVKRERQKDNRAKAKDKGGFFSRQYQDDFFTDEDDIDNDGDVDQEDEFLDAQNDLDGDEETNGEDTFGDDFDDGDDDGPAVSATAGDGVAEASTPNAAASAGDPDELAPQSDVPDDVVDEIPTSGPLPNTSGSALWVYAMVGTGSMLFLGALIRRMWRAE